VTLDTIEYVESIQFGFPQKQANYLETNY